MFIPTHQNITQTPQHIFQSSNDHLKIKPTRSALFLVEVRHFHFMFINYFNKLSVTVVTHHIIIKLSLSCHKRTTISCLTNFLTNYHLRPVQNLGYDVPYLIFHSYPISRARPSYSNSLKPCRYNFPLHHLRAV